MRKIISTILIMMSLTSFVQQANAEKKGKFNNYTQVTDKEVLITSTKGVKVLFSAYDQHSIGIRYFNGKEEVKLISPKNIFDHVELSGSMYVEELDELMQITTTSDKGLVIKIDKKNFEFTFIDKSNNQEILVEENLSSNVVSNEGNLIVGNDTLGLPNAIHNTSL